MIAKPVITSAATTYRTADPAMGVTPERIAIRGETYWLASANGLAITQVTNGPDVDPARGAIAIMVYRRAHDGMRDGMALPRTMNPDDAEEIAGQLLAAAQTARRAAAEDAATALRKAAGKGGVA